MGQISYFDFMLILRDFFTFKRTKSLAAPYIDFDGLTLLTGPSPSPLCPAGVGCTACAWRSRGRTARTRCACRSWRRTGACRRRPSSSASSRCRTPTTGAAEGSCTSTVGDGSRGRTRHRSTPCTKALRAPLSRCLGTGFVPIRWCLSIH